MMIYGIDYDLLSLGEWEELGLDTTGSSGCRLYPALWYAWSYYVGWWEDHHRVFVQTRERRARVPSDPDGDRSFVLQESWPGIASFFPDPDGQESTRHRDLALQLAGTMNAITWYLESPSNEQLEEIGEMVTYAGVLLADTLGVTTEQPDPLIPASVEITEALGAGGSEWAPASPQLVARYQSDETKFREAGDMFIVWGNRISARARAVTSGLQVPGYMGPADLLCFTNVEVDSALDVPADRMLGAGVVIAAVLFFTWSRYRAN